MQYISNELREILKSGDIYAPEAKVILKNVTTGAILSFTELDLLAGVTIKETALSPSGAPIGGLAMSGIEVKLQSFDSMLDKMINPKEEYTVQFELAFPQEDKPIQSTKFYVSEVDISEDNMEITIKGLDAISKLDVEYREVSEEFPISAANWLVKFSEAYQIDFYAPELLFENQMINQPDIENMSARQVLSKFLEWNLSFGAIKNDKVHIQPVEFPEALAPTETFERDAVMNYKRNKGLLGTLGVNTLTLALSEDVESENSSLKDDSMITQEGQAIEVRLSGNPFFSTPEERRLYIPIMFEKIKGFNFQPFELETRAFYLEIGDPIRQTGLDTIFGEDKSYNVVPYDKVFTYDGSFKTIYSAAPMDSAETAYKWATFSPRKRTEILVNKLENQITLVTEKVDGYDDKIAKIEVGLDGVKTSVEHTERVVNNMEIGGRNLLFKTGVEIAQNGQDKDYAPNQPEFFPNTDYSLSLFAEVKEAKVDGKVGGSFKVTYVDNTEVEYELWQEIKEGQSFRGRLRGHFKLEDKEILLVHNFWARTTTLAEAEEITVRAVKLEQGTKSTQWTPAPEDINQEIGDAMGEVMDVVTTNYATVTLLKDSITNEVTARKEMGDELVEEMTSQIQQTAKSFEIIFNKLENDQNLNHDEIALIQSYFKINENGVIIGKSGSQIEFFAENERVGFRDKQLGDIAYWEGGTMHVDKLIAVVTIMVGFHVIERYKSTVAGNTTVVRMGVN